MRYVLSTFCKLSGWFLVCCCLAACGAASPDPVKLTESDLEPLYGDGRDMHGCVVSAGYSWCAETGRCERPWVLADLYKFNNSPQAFEKFCREK